MQICDAILIPDTMILQVKVLGQGQPNDIYLLDCKKRPIGDINITVVYDGETESPHIDIIEPDTYLDPIFSGTKTLPELVKRQDIPNIYI